MREPLLNESWFRYGRKLAIADVVYVKNIGLCSHQPVIGTPYLYHRLLDFNGNYYYIKDDNLLFTTTRSERDEYWKQFRKNGL